MDNILEQQLQTVQSGVSQLDIGITFRNFLQTERFDEIDESKLVHFLHQEWKKNFDSGRINCPLFQSKVIEGISLKILRSWIKLEKYFLNLSKENVGSSTNFLITGTKGVGKTTLMKGLKLIIDQNCINVATMFIDYETKKSNLLPSNNLLGFDQATDFDQDTFDAFAKKRNKGLIFFGDEIQELYKDLSKLDVVRELIVIGKAGCSMGIISGSSSNVRALAFNQIQEDKYLRYPNLNHSVYSEVHLDPLRFEIEIRQYLQTKGITDMDPMKLFELTGGVGRHMDKVLSTRSMNIHSEIMIKMESDSIFGSVVGVIYKNYLEMRDSGSMSWTQPRISLAEIIKLEALGCVNRWVDEGFLYACKSYYELLIPLDLKHVQDFLTENPNYLRSIAFRVTIGGWEGHGSGGQVLESYIIEKYIEADVFPFAGSIFSNERISVGETTSSISASGAIILSLANTKLEYLLNRVTSVTKESGIDAIILNSSENNTIDITAIQIKSGMLTENISMGTSNKNPNASRHFVAILTKANIGCENLLTLFRANFVNSQFRITQFVLVASKKVAEDIEEKTTVTICGDEVSFICLNQTKFIEVFKDELERFNLL